MISDFPLHKCGLILHHNEHKNYYETIEQTLGEHYDWINNEEKELALKNDDVWTLQFYPDTPTGFYAFAAYNLENLLKFCREIK